MAGPGESGEQDDWVQPLGFDIKTKDYPFEKIEKAVKAGYRIVKKDDKTMTVTERVIVKGNKKTDPLDVSE
jgi:hypothetical protein